VPGGASFLGIAIESAGAGIHGRNELKIGGESQQAFGAADGDDFIFHRLAHHFEHALAELGEFIQEQYTPVSQ
jgi:hypothetical protein